MTGVPTSSLSVGKLRATVTVTSTSLSVVLWARGSFPPMNALSATSGLREVC